MLRKGFIIFFGLILCSVIFWCPAYSQKSSDIPIWKEGFSEKEYKKPFNQVDDAIMQDIFGFVLDKGVVKGKTMLTGKIIIVGSQKLDGGGITTYGVGDKKGKWRNWNGVGTINGLKIRDGGSIIKVKLIKTGYNTTIVGFNVDETDRKQSEELHKLLETKLQKR